MGRVPRAVGVAEPAEAGRRQSAKNGADIRIAVKVMTALRAETRYDEFVLASGDADFRPLLQVLRAHDRRVTVISTGSSTAAYEALADQLLDEQDVIELTQPGDLRPDPSQEARTLDAPLPSGEAGTREEWEYDTFVSIARAEYADADAPVNLSGLSLRLRTACPAPERPADSCARAGARSPGRRAPAGAHEVPPGDQAAGPPHRCLGAGPPKPRRLRGPPRVQLHRVDPLGP